MKIEDVDAIPVSGLVKGLPNGILPFPLGEVGARGWNLLREDVPLPAAVLKASALEHNARVMADFLAASGARIAPHGKTTMSPHLFERQLAGGAFAITVATTQQLEVCHTLGVRRVLFANQLVGAQAVRYVLDLLSSDPGFELFVLADSVDGVRLVVDALGGRRLASPLNVLLEVGHAGGRTGCRDLEAALRVARAVRAAEPNLRLRGVEGFEGLIRGATPLEQEARVLAFLDVLVATAEACARDGLISEGPVVLSAGGSAFYDLVVARLGRAALGREHLVLTRSGCYLSHDSGMYRRHVERARERTPALARHGEAPRPALEIWAYVQSRPEPGKAILTMGKRDTSGDSGAPVPAIWHRPGSHAEPAPLPPGCAITDLNDQHAHMAVPEDFALGVGDMVGFGVSHPCLTFDRWQVLYVVDDRYDIVSAVRTFF